MSHARDGLQLHCFVWGDLHGSELGCLRDVVPGNVRDVYMPISVDN